MTRRKTKASAGISLIEILVVLAIIGMIMGLVAPRILDYFGRAKSQSATIQMANIKGALQLLYIDIGRYPNEAEGLNLLLSAPDQLKGWNGPYLDSEDGIKDPWGRRYIFRFPGQDKDFDLFSLGRDGQSGGTKEDADIFL
ncbi:type II secretion system protein GspG [Amylibacter sp. SFDW26]|uniref:type II secretion system major pseudopilin GspG n=1 Tax=Amylibacter sp. SFDW26 TaxID=2652722 RepID=UPI0012624554|nr:type II secretion system major pseudopilin GspG [Amylibacter sp. SFDW26]KAB7610193.1 type II secretion system protein GspG [Amylibacter sp. SFDW26]